MRNSKLACSNQVEQEQKHLDYEKYTNYVDPSAMTIDHYKRKGIFDGLSRYTLRIEQWLADTKEQEQNKPLIFHSEPGAGKKSMIVQWLEQHNSQWSIKRQKSLVLLHFGSIGGNNTNYFHAIYRLLIKLREALKIKQKVELLQEKIRKYFAYWLDVCSNELEKQLVVNETTEIYNKIIIVIEGIENFLDADTGRESNIAFWLPRNFPKNIKVIVTTTSSSEALAYFTKIGCQTIQVEHSTDVQDQLIKRATNHVSLVDSTLKEELLLIQDSLSKKSVCRKNLYSFTEIFQCALIATDNRTESQTIKFISKCLKQKLRKDTLKKIESLDQLYDFLIGFWDEQLDVKGKIKDLLLALSITQKGLTSEELQHLCNIDSTQWKWLSAVFRVVLIEYKGLWMIHDATFKAAVTKRYGVKDDIIINIHERTADTLDQTPNSIRKLEQQTYHLYASKSYFKLKEKISSIQNFLLLFNPNNKYDLSRYWQKLEEKGFDPVIEYNKAIEGFSMHYHPTEENIFRIIVQISRFLKEFCDFETFLTPNFRHPPIEGNIVEMDKIGLLTELEKLNIYVDNSCLGAQDKVVSHPSLNDQIKELKTKIFEERKSDNSLKNTANNSPNRSISPNGNMLTSEIGQRKVLVMHILNEIEQLNVDVPKNREKFRAYYVNLLKDYMHTKEIVSTQNSKAIYLETQQDGDDSDGENRQNSKVFRKDKQTDIKLTKIQETYNTTDVTPALYYYKRWIWIQFPWACISLQNDYSKTPELCLTSATEYMSVESEAEFTRQALKIAIEAKEKKKLMFTRKCDDSTMNGPSKKIHSVSKKNVSTSQSQFGNSRDMVSALKPFDTNTVKDEVITLKINKGTLAAMNISLSTLTKELEAKKMVCELRQVHGEDHEGNCLEEMEFIGKRKTFKMGNYIDGMTKNEQLPKLKNEIKAHTDYELSYIKGHIEGKKKVINQIIYENSKLIGLYRELKIKEQQTIGSPEEGAGRRIRPMQDLNLKKDRTITEFCKSLLQKERLKIILKLCSENKTKNEEYLTSLNYLLQNLKKMIKWETGDMKRREDELAQIQQLNLRTVQAQREKERNDELLKAEIQHSLVHKEELEKQISNMQNVISKEVNSRKNKLEDNISGDRLKIQQKTKQLQLERNTQMIQEELEMMEVNYSKLAELLDIRDFDYASSAKFKKLMEQKERNRELNIIYFERRNKLEKLNSTLNKHTDDLEICYSSDMSKTHDTVTPEVLEDPNHTKVNDLNKQLKNLKDASMRMKICFQNLTIQLKLKDTTKKDSVLQQINSRLQRLKQHSNEKYQNFMDNKIMLDGPTDSKNEPIAQFQ